MLSRTERRITTVVPFVWPARRRRNAYEKSAKENRLAIAMKVRSGRGMPRKATRRVCDGTRARCGSRTRSTMRTERTAGNTAGRGAGREASGGGGGGAAGPRRSRGGEGARGAPGAVLLRWEADAFPPGFGGGGSL